ncbi:MAG: polyhydroxyalkanoic acid system family protein [Planctomycetia bacterium]|nr:polyhydroxyalkanoic acid system family protein [Planctomycetia bacterium]
MPKLVKSIPHQLGREEAVARIKNAIEKEKVAKSNIVSASTDTWVSDHEMNFSLTIFGYNIHGDLNVGEFDVQIMLDLPVVAVMVKGMIESQLESEIHKLLS